MNRLPMYMKDWILRLDNFLVLTGKNILDHSGKISHELAIEKAHFEYEKYKQLKNNEASKVEQDFMAHIELQTKKIKK